VTICQTIYAPERVEKIIPMAPAGLNLTTTEILPRIFSYIFFPSKAKQEDLIRWFIGENPKVVDAFYDLMLAAVQGFPRVPIPIILSARKLKKIKAPAFFILGEKDPAIPAYQVKPRVERHVPHAQVEIIPNVGHVLNIEAAEVVDEMVIGFLGG
jgi:pimeloyl-ACP methyl ester carboxylesterase